MRSNAFIFSLLLITLLLLIGCSSNGQGGLLSPSADGRNSFLDGVQQLNTELDDIHLAGASILNQAYVELRQGTKALPLLVESKSGGNIKLAIDGGLIQLPDGTRVAEYDGINLPVDVIPGIDKGLFTLDVTLKGETEHFRRYWLAINQKEDFPTPPHKDAKVITTDGETLEVCADELLVAVKPDTDPGDFGRLLKLLDMQILEKLLDTDVYRVAIRPGMNLFQMISIVEASSIVEYAEPNFIRRACITPNDTAWNQKWDLQIMDGPAGWDVYQGDPDLIVGVIDSGIDRNHPDLAAKVVDGKDFITGGDGLGGATDGDGIDNNGNNVVDENVGHGTHVAGIIGAVSNNSKGTTGVDWSCKLMGLRIFPADGDGGAATSSITNALNYAKIQANLVAVNMSIGGGGFSQTEQNTMNSVFSAGVVICASAGNDGSTFYSYPASYDNVVSVAATDSNDKKTSFSQYNNKVDVSAPGLNIYSTYYNDTYAVASGTSMSCPEVTGLMSLVRGYYPTYTTQEVVDQVLYTADNIDDKNPNYIGGIGSGRVNIQRALTQHLQPEYTILGAAYDDDQEGLTRGNRDGFFNPGEVVEVLLTVRNDGIKDATNPVATLQTNDTYVHVINGEVTFPNIQKTQVKQANAKFLISIDNNCPDAHPVSYTITFNDNEGSGPHVKPGSWKIFKDNHVPDAICLTAQDILEGLRIFKGISNQAIIRVDVTGDVNYGTIDELTFTKFGSVATNAITGIRLYHDTDGDGKFDLDGHDLQLGVDDYYNPGYAGNFDNLKDQYSGHPNGPINEPYAPVKFDLESRAHFHGIYLPASVNQENSFFVVIDLALQATSGSTLQLGVMSASDLQLRTPDQPDPACLPLTTSEFVVASTWQTDQQITSGDSAHSWRPEGACDSLGNIFIVFDDDRDGNFNVYFKSSSNMGTDFAADYVLDSDAANDFYPSIAVDQNDVLHVVFYSTRYSTSNREIIYMRSTTHGATWEVPVRLTNASGDSRTPDIAVSPDGTLHVVWFDDRAGGVGFYYKQSSDGGENWTEDKYIAANTYYDEFPPPSIAVGGDGVIHVAWEKWVVQGQYLVGFDVNYCKSENNGSTFTSITNLTPGSGGWDYAVRLAADPAGNPYVVYHHAEATGEYNIFIRYSTDGGDNFNTKNLTSASSNSCIRPDIFINTDGIIDCVFKNNLGGDYNIYHTFSSTGINGFNEPVQISFGAGVETKDEWPRVMRGPEKNIYSFWADTRTGQHEIFFNRYLY